MFYVDFIDDAPAMAVTSLEAGANVRSFASEAAFNALYPSFNTNPPVDEGLPQFKREKIAELNSAIGQAQHRIIGEPDAERQERFKINARIARGVLNGSASSVEQVALQGQLEVNKRLNPAAYSAVTLPTFAAWIRQQDDLAISTASRLEVIFLEGRAAISDAANRGAVINVYNAAVAQLTS
jgi:hypothetical protein